MNNSSSLLLALGMIATLAHAQPTPQPVSFEFDGFTVRAYQDAPQEIPRSVFSNEHGVQPTNATLRSSCNVFLVTEGDRRVLIDAGNGAPRGSLREQLRADGIAPESIGDILLTHEHHDHFGGLLQPDGSATFPNAVVHLDAKTPTSVLAPLRKAGYTLDIFPDAATASLPLGFTAQAAPGHTPAHVFYAKGNALFIADAFHGADLQIPHPDYCAKWDQDRPRAIADRRALLERLSKEPDLALFGAHVPFPGVLRSSSLPDSDAQ